MARKNPGDILGSAWNPVIGCDRYSAGCAGCWYLDGIFPWQQRLGNIPAHVMSSDSYTFRNRMCTTSLKTRSGIVGIVQHGDLFYEGHPDSLIHEVLDIVDEVAQARRVTPTYVLWTKRSRRMADLLTARYPTGMPPYLVTAVSVEERASLPRIDDLERVDGTRILVLEPLLEGVQLGRRLRGLHWVILGSETGTAPRPLQLDWVRDIRDEVKRAGIPFFVKQLGASHKHQERSLDGVEWSEFPPGFVK